MDTPAPVARSAPDLIGGYQVIRPSLDRQLAMDAFAAIDVGHPMVGLLELDVTRAQEALATAKARGERVSLFAFMVRAIAIAVSEHPDLNLVRHGKRLVHFDDVDVSVPVEVRTHTGMAPREVVVRRAQDKSVPEIYAELAAARERHQQLGETSSEDRWVRRIATAVRWLPRFLRIALVRVLVRDAFRTKARAGTTIVTSVAKFADLPGFSFTFTTGPRAAGFVVGSVVDKPWVHEGQVAVRSVLSLSMMVDHDLVDGGPVARFALRLRDLVESADGLSTDAEQVPEKRALAARSDVHASGQPLTSA